MVDTALLLLSAINAHGYEAYIVGGAVRDIIMGHAPKDVDIATNMPISELEKHWKCHDIGKSKDFGIVAMEFNGSIYEVAQFRKDGKYTDGRRPSEVEIGGTIEDDLARRDFTINAMAMDKDRNIIDPFNGRESIRNKLISCVGQPMDRFGEDYLRILRGIRFATRFGFKLDYGTAHAMNFYGLHLTRFTSAERIGDELTKMAFQNGETFARSIMMMKDVGILYWILPDINRMDQYDHTPEFHPEGNVWEHTIEAIKAYKGTDYRVNIALLLHDVGKTTTQGFTPGKITYHGHESESVKIAEVILKKYKFPNHVIDTILFTIGNHMRACRIDDMRPGKIYQMAAHPDWELLQDVLYSDKVARGDRFDRERFDKLMQKYEETALKWKDRLDAKSEHIVSGHYVMNLTGLPPGPAVGRILREITEWAIEGDMNDPKDIDRMIKYLATKET